MVLQLWYRTVQEEEVDGQPKVIKPPLLFSVARASAILLRICHHP